MSYDEHSQRLMLGTRLREQREYLGYSQDEVAAAVGIPRSAISLVETGQRKLETLELMRFAKIYERPISYFTGDDTQLAAIPESVSMLARLASSLKQSDVDELKRFAEFLRARDDSKQGKLDE